MLTCRDVCDNATRHIEGPTGFADRFALRLHLLLCRECRRFMRQFRMMIGAAEQLNELPGPTDEEIDALVNKLAMYRKS